jgi:hypothetical protein
MIQRLQSAVRAAATLAVLAAIALGAQAAQRWH